MNGDGSISIRGDPGFVNETRSKGSSALETGGNFLWSAGLLIITWMAMAVSNVALSEHVSWHQQSLSYTVHLGVVPASVAAQDEKLVAIHKVARHGAHKQRGSTRHVLVAVFKHPSMERLDNASVVAEVVENDLIHIKRTKKPLEIMGAAGTATYCNFFDLHWNGKYRIHVRIHEPGKKTEEVTFLQEAYGLAD